MKKKTTFYVSRKNALTWIGAAILLISIFARIAFFCEKGADTKTVLLQIVLPVAATLLLILRALLDGQEHFYKTATDFFLMMVYLGIVVCQWELSLRVRLLYWACLFVSFLLYREVTCGRFPRLYPILCLLLAGGSSFFVYDVRKALLSASVLSAIGLLRDAIGAFGLLFLILAMRQHRDGRYHSTWGDRKDGRRIRTLNPISRVANYIMPNRNGANVALRDKVELTELERMVRKLRLEGYPGLGITEVFIAAYARCVAQYPAFNRFLSGQNVYSRGEDIQLCIAAKKDLTTEGEETIIKLHISPRDTVFDVYKKFRAAVAEIKHTEEDSHFDNVARLINYIPGVVLKFAIWLIKLLDYFDLIPGSLLEVSPFHASMFLTSSASIGLPAVIHHLYDFGNNPVFCAIGSKIRTQEIAADGTVTMKKYLDFTINVDERIVDGFYYSEVLRLFRRLIRNPQQLLTPPETINRDID